MSNFKNSKEKKTHTFSIDVLSAVSVCLWSGWSSKNAFDIITESEFITQKKWFSYFLVKWVYNTAIHGICWMLVHILYDDFFLSIRKKTHTVSNLNPCNQLDFHNSIAMLCCKNRQLQWMYNMHRHINGSVCLSLQSIQCIILFSKKSICVIFLLRTRMQRPNIQLTHTQLYDFSDFYLQQNDL